MPFYDWQETMQGVWAGQSVPDRGLRSPTSLMIANHRLT